MAQSLLGLSDGLQQLEKCQFVNCEVELPITLLEDVNVFMEVMSLQTWQSELSDAQRKHLNQFLPTFPKSDAQEKQITVRKVFAGENVKFGNPLRQFHARLKEGTFSPDIARYIALCRKAKLREYRYQQQVYYTNLLKDILVNRQRLLEQVYQTPVNEPLQLKVKQYPAPREDGPHSIQKRVQRRYVRILREVNEECGAETSDEEEASITPEPKMGPQPVCRPLFPESPPETAGSGVLPTFGPKPNNVNGQPSTSTVVARPSPRSPIEVTEDDYREILSKHRKRKADGELHPELDTANLTLQDILSRAMPAKKSAGKSTAVSNLTPALLKKKLKEKSEKKKKKIKVKEEGEEVPEMSENIVVAVPAGCEIPQDESAMDGMVPTDETDALPVQTSQTVVPTNAGQPANFFSLLRDFICEDQDGKTTTTKLEERVRDWQDSAGPTHSWFTEQARWPDLVAPALKFLSGDVLGLTIENFIPLLDYKERAQQWKWIGKGRDADEQLHPLYRHWLENKDDTSQDTQDGLLSSPPAPKMRTSFVVRPTNDEEKSLFQKQEQSRFSQPHKAFTYMLHGYSSVVGPVKGVYAKESTMNKARDHVLLIKERPPYVTILTLVRDAAARLPNGEGTRGDICELLKDSQFLAEGVTDSQINSVVSGALDRLHYEKDPCVKYDVNRKLWIYLHRNRTEDEFEKIHQAQGAAAKAKKALQKPKPAKKIKESVQAMAAGAVPSVAPPDSPLRIETPSPGGTNVSPRAQVVSPRTPQMSPRTPAQASPKQTPQAKTPQASPKLVTTSANQLAASPRVAASVMSQVLASGNVPKAATAIASTVSTSIKTATVAQTVASLQAASQQHQQQVQNTQAAATSVASTLSLSQQLAAGKAGGGVTMIGGSAATKPLSLAFLQQHVAAAAANKAVTTTTTQAAGTPPVVGAAASKPLTFSLIQSPVSAKVSEPSGQAQSPGQTRTVVLTSKGETIGQKLLLTHQQLQQQQHIQQLQQHLQQQQQQQAAAGAGQARPVMASPKLQKVSQPPPASSPVTLVTTSGKGSATKVVQQIASTTNPQMVTVPNMGLASVASLQKQMPNSTTIKIQGGSILQSSSSKPLTIQRMASLEGAEVKAGQVILQRSPSVEPAGGDRSPSTTVYQQHVAPGSPQLTINRQGGKPATLVFTKPGSSIGGKPAASASTVTTVAGSLAAQLIQTTSIGGRPVAFGGKPIIIGGKPVQLSGKPIQIGGKPVHLIGKPGGGQIGVIQGQGGVMSAVNIVTQATTGASSGTSLTSVPQARLISTPTATAPTLVGQILQSSGGAVVQAGRTAGATTVSTSKTTIVSGTGHGKVASPSTAAGVMVSQLTSAAQAKTGAVVSQPKVVTASGPASVLGHQILVAPGSASAKVVNAQQLLAATGGVRPGLLTRSPGGKPGTNIQVVKTMLSQASGGKPGQTTIVLAQPGGQQVTVAGVEQLAQAGVKTVPATAKSKAGPVYARIITPPPGIRLAAVRPGTPVIPGVSMLQAVGARLQSDGQIVSSGTVTNVTSVASKASDGANNVQK